MTGTPTILGIDGGGSKTLMALGDRSGRILRMSRAGGVNPMDNPRWREMLSGGLTQFADEPELAGVAAALPVFGEVESSSRAQEQVLAEIFNGRPQLVLNDVDAAQIGAFAGSPGILVLAGTGSMAWARDAAGKSFRVGGWGDQIGDEGSSYWIGRLLLSLVTQSIDGRAPPTVLVDAVFGHLGLDRADPMNALEGWVTHLDHPRSGIAALAIVVTQAAAAGDKGADGLVTMAAQELAKHILAVARLSGLPPDWSYAGGVLTHPLIRDSISTIVGRPPLAPILPPVGGAVLAAARCAGWAVDDGFIRQLAASIQNQTAPLAASTNDRQRRPN